MMFLMLDADESVKGPLGLDELERAIREGLLRPHALVSRYGGKWHLAFSVPELREFFLKHRAVHEPAVTQLREAEDLRKQTTDNAPRPRRFSLRKAA